MTKVLVAYFSASGITKNVAEKLAGAIGADSFEIKPAVPYSKNDLNWMDKSSRSSVEMKDIHSRPEIVPDNLDIKEYDLIFLGFPIWWYIAPTIINTFLEKHNFASKRIILFATSGGSGFGKAVESLKPSVPYTTIITEGKILNNNPSEEELKRWASIYIY